MMTKALTLTWIPSGNLDSAVRSDYERKIQIIFMELDGKTNSFNNEIKVGPYTVQRQWRDQEAVDEYIEFMYNLAIKYNGTTIVGETIDL